MNSYADCNKKKNVRICCPSTDALSLETELEMKRNLPPRKTSSCFQSILRRTVPVDIFTNCQDSLQQQEVDLVVHTNKKQMFTTQMNNNNCTEASSLRKMSSLNQQQQEKRFEDGNNATSLPTTDPILQEIPHPLYTVTENNSVHAVFLMLLIPVLIGMTRYVSVGELVLLIAFSVLTSGYFYILCYQKIACVHHNTQISVLVSIRDLIQTKLNSTKVIYLADEMEDDLDGDPNYEPPEIITSCTTTNSVTDDQVELEIGNESKQQQLSDDWNQSERILSNIASEVVKEDDKKCHGSSRLDESDESTGSSTTDISISSTEEEDILLDRSPSDLNNFPPETERSKRYYTRNQNKIALRNTSTVHGVAEY